MAFRAICVLLPLLMAGVLASPMSDMLDSMQHLMTGEPRFNRQYYARLLTCMDAIDPLLKLSHNAAWKGIAAYWKMGGAADDRWGTVPSEFRECNATVSNYDGMVIYEPCNYASNIAYYRSFTEICGRLERRRQGDGFSLPRKYVASIAASFVHLTAGSSFMHGSNTLLGYDLDIGTLSVMAYQMHQAIFADFSKSPVLHDLGENFRQLTAHQQIDALKTMFISQPVTEWSAFITKLDIPDQFTVYAALTVTALNIGLSESVADSVTTLLMNLFSPPAEVVDFTVNKFVPELRQVLKRSQTPKHKKLQFFINAVGTIGKLLYAFVWQEKVVISSRAISLPIVNFWGTMLLPLVNFKVNILQSYRYADTNFQAGRYVYPGEDFCNVNHAHATWHLQSAIGLLNTVYLADDAYKFVSGTH